MEPESSLPHSQASATCPYPEPARSSPYPYIPLPEDPSSYYPTIYAWFFQVALSLRFPHQNPVKPSSPPIRSTCPAHFLLLDLITGTILGEEYRSFSSPFSFLHSLVTSSLLGPNIPLSTLFSNTPQPTFLPQCEQSSFTLIQNRGKIIVLYVLILYFCIANWKTKNLHRKTINIPWLQSALNFFLNRTLIH